MEPTTPSGSANSDAANSVLIGNRASLDRAFNGSMDDVRIYNRALTAKEIQALYKAGGGVTQGSTANTKANTNGTGISGGLVGHWTFDGKNMTNATATDISGSGNNGTLTNMTASSSAVAGKIGQALTFDSVNDKINMGAPSTLNLTSTLTISAWIYPKSYGGTNKGRIVDKDGSATSGYVLMVDNSNISNGLSFGIDSSGSGQNVLFRSFANTITLNKWQHVVTTLNSSNILTMFVNGVNVGTATASFPSSGSDNFVIGGRTIDDGRNFDGKIDDVRVYNRALSASEVQALYKSGQVAIEVSPVANVSSAGTGINSGLVGYWTFDGKNMTNATATDSSGNGNNGTLINGPTKVIGKMGQGLKFIGPNAGSPRYVSVPNSSSLNMNGRNTITLASWVKFNSFYSGTCLHNTLIQKGDDNNVGYYGLSVGDTGGCGAATGVRYLDFSFRDSGGTQYVLTATTTDNFKINTWYHVASVCNGTTCTLYRNGVNIGSSAISAAIGSDTDLLSIGEASQNLAGFKYSIDGVQDDVRIYNRALSPAEVKSLYKLGAQ